MLHAAAGVVCALYSCRENVSRVKHSTHVAMRERVTYTRTLTQLARELDGNERNGGSECRPSLVDWCVTWARHAGATTPLYVLYIYGMLHALHLEHNGKADGGGVPLALRENVFEVASR